MQAVTVLFGIKPQSFLDPTDPRYVFSDMWEALRGAGITMFTREFLIIPHEEIIELKTSSDTHRTMFDQDLTLTTKARFRIMRAWCHYKSRKIGKPYFFKAADAEEHRIFLTRDYNSSAPITPWGLPDKGQSLQDQEIHNWKKSVRPDERAYKTFRRDNEWKAWEEHFVTTLKAQGIHHLIEQPTDLKGDPLPIENTELDTPQRNFVFSLMLNKMENPTCRQIIVNHQKERDTRQIWKEIKD